jgi:hypothetical protein
MHDPLERIALQDVTKNIYSFDSTKKATATLPNPAALGTGHQIFNQTRSQKKMELDSRYNRRLSRQTKFFDQLTQEALQEMTQRKSSFLDLALAGKEGGAVRRGIDGAHADRDDGFSQENSQESEEEEETNSTEDSLLIGDVTATTAHSRARSGTDPGDASSVSVGGPFGASSGGGFTPRTVVTRPTFLLNLASLSGSTTGERDEDASQTSQRAQTERDDYDYAKTPRIPDLLPALPELPPAPTANPSPGVSNSSNAATSSPNHSSQTSQTSQTTTPRPLGAHRPNGEATSTSAAPSPSTSALLASDSSGSTPNSHPQREETGSADECVPIASDYNAHGIPIPAPAPVNSTPPSSLPSMGLPKPGHGTAIRAQYSGHKPLSLSSGAASLQSRFEISSNSNSSNEQQPSPQPGHVRASTTTTTHSQQPASRPTVKPLVLSANMTHVGSSLNSPTSASSPHLNPHPNKVSNNGASPPVNPSSPQAFMQPPFGTNNNNSNQTNNNAPNPNPNPNTNPNVNSAAVRGGFGTQKIKNEDYVNMFKFDTLDEITREAPDAFIEHEDGIVIPDDSDSCSTQSNTFTSYSLNSLSMSVGSSSSMTSSYPNSPMISSMPSSLEAATPIHGQGKQPAKMFAKPNRPPVISRSPQANFLAAGKRLDVQSQSQSQGQPQGQSSTSSLAPNAPPNLPQLTQQVVSTNAERK